MTPCIYKITCLGNGKIYIGSTINFPKRFHDHFKQLASGSHKNRHLQSAYEKYGKSKFYIEVLELLHDRSKLLEREKFWIDKTRCFDRKIGFNICIQPANSLGIKRTEEFKNKVRMANVSRSPELKAYVRNAVINANTGRVPWNKGTKMWETRKHPASNKGRKFPNRKFSQEGYEKICQANRRARSPEYKKFRSAISSKSYYFIDPKTGCELKIRNLSEYCDKNGLNKAHMYQVAKGNIHHHRGWIRDEDCYVEPDIMVA